MFDQLFFHTVVRAHVVCDASALWGGEWHVHARGTPKLLGCRVNFVRFQDREIAARWAETPGNFSLSGVVK